MTVRLRRESSHGVLEVQDTGQGIAPSTLPHVFEPFTQAPQTLDRSRGGLGLGLALVRGLVELHGGSVSMTSSGLSRGSTCTVRLPLTRAAPPPPAPAPPVVVRRWRVLVIEDNVEAAEALQMMLETVGHDVQVSYTGPDGLTKADAFRPEVVICDIGLPGMNGYAVARAIRSNPALRDEFLVALSGYAAPEDLKQSAEAGFDRHLAKPARMDTINRLLADA